MYCLIWKQPAGPAFLRGLLKWLAAGLSQRTGTVTARDEVACSGKCEASVREASCGQRIGMGHAACVCVCQTGLHVVIRLEFTHIWQESTLCMTSRNVFLTTTNTVPAVLLVLLQSQVLLVVVTWGWGFFIQQLRKGWKKNSKARIAKGKQYFDLVSQPRGALHCIFIYVLFEARQGVEAVIRFRIGNIEHTQRQIQHDAFLIRISKDPLKFNLRRSAAVGTVFVLEWRTLADVIW